jgi:alpha-L-fucosidase
MKKKLCAAMLALLMVGSSAHSQNLLNETQEQKDKRMEWFYKAKLGIFIHWGVYAVRVYQKAGHSITSICLTMNT